MDIDVLSFLSGFSNVIISSMKLGRKIVAFILHIGLLWLQKRLALWRIFTLKVSNLFSPEHTLEGKCGLNLSAGLKTLPISFSCHCYLSQISN